MEELKGDLLEEEVSQECSVDEQNLRLKKNEESRKTSELFCKNLRVIVASWKWV
jgi:hypothetical protein